MDIAPVTETSICVVLFISPGEWIKRYFAMAMERMPINELMKNVTAYNPKVLVILAYIKSLIGITRPTKLMIAAGGSLLIKLIGSNIKGMVESDFIIWNIPKTSSEALISSRR